MLRRRSPGDAAASRGLGVRPWGGRACRCGGGGGSTPAPFTRGHNSRPFPPSPGKGDGDAALGTGRTGGCSLGASGDQPRGRVPPRSVLGDPPRDLGGSAGSSGGRRYRHAGRGMRGGAGSPGGSVPAGGTLPRSPGAAGAKPRRAGGAGGVGAAYFVVKLSGPKTPRFTPKTSAGAGRGRRPCEAVPEGGPRPWDTGGDIFARFVA